VDQWGDGMTALEADNDYMISISAINNYGATSATPTRGDFSTDSDPTRRLSSSFNSTRSLTQSNVYILQEDTTVSAGIYAFTFQPVDYETCCQVRVTTHAANCASEAALDDCCTYIDCPETPQVECSKSRGGEENSVVAAWSDTVNGNGDHFEEWAVVTTETVVGPYFCGESNLGCGVVVPLWGLSVCSENLSQDFYDLIGCDTESDGESTLWDACPQQCNALWAMSEALTGQINKLVY